MRAETLHYERCASSNLYFVPVLRNRLTFSVLVRKALDALTSETAWSREDLIAVVLPASVRSRLEEGINLLPRVSLLIANMVGEGAREVFPITPCDAMIEAVRVANEEGWPLEFLDLEVSPGNLLRGPCLRNPNWPDDALITRIGASNYLDLSEDYFSQPPARLEPLDTWRESSITTRLQELQPLWRRILVVCDAGLVRSVMARLQRDVFTPAPNLGHHLRKFEYQLVQQLRPEVLLSYLDDYPKLVERYENQRRRSPYPWDTNFSDTFVHTFDKLNLLLDIVQEMTSKAHDLHFSTRQHKAFDAFLSNLLRSAKRLSPQPDVLYGAVASCYGIALAERLHAHLTGYFSQINVEWVKRHSSAEPGLFRYKLDVDSTRHGYYGRTCNPIPPSYEIIRPPKVASKPDPDQRNNESVYMWLPEIEFHRQMYRKLQNVSTAAKSEPRSILYQGSVEMGIDIRRTIKTSYRGIPKLFVKAYSRKRIPISTEKEPVVWILSEDWSCPGEFESHPIPPPKESKLSNSGRNKESFYIGTLNCIAKLAPPAEYDEIYYRSHETGRTLSYSHEMGRTLSYDGRRRGRVWYKRRLCILHFAFDHEDENSARQVYENEFDARVPNHGEFEHPMGCVHRDLAELAKEVRSWLVIALLMALKYAKNAVVVVAPPDLAIPETVLQHPLAAGKSFVFISSTKFSRSEREKLSTKYLYLSEGGKDEEAEQAFRIIMKRFWE